MLHILDNPIWNALTTGNKDFAFGNEKAKYIKRDVGLFAGMKNNSGKDFQELYIVSPPKSFLILFVPEEIQIPAGWHIELKKEILQMAYLKERKQIFDDTEIKNLGEEHIPAMQKLTKMTNPGPFLPRTIDFGYYQGIFNQNQLIAMTGQRLHPDPYIEISAVCTHPDYTGKGYAAKLVNSQINIITGMSRIPFLHVYQDNLAAVKLYEKLGFQIRKQMLVYMIQKES
ncbi:MAG: GNAT family N-acetyltransferase [Flavisolibacter sp.]